MAEIVGKNLYLAFGGTELQADFREFSVSEEVGVANLRFAQGVCFANVHMRVDVEFCRRQNLPVEAKGFLRRTARPA